MARDTDLSIGGGGGEGLEQAPSLVRAFSEHQGDLIRFLAKRLRCLFTARDVAQEVYLRTLRVPEAQVENPRAFLFEIASNLAIDHERVEGRRSELLEEVQDLLWTEEDKISPERQALAEDELALLHAALERLPERARLVFYLNRFDGLTQREIAERLGISRTNVEKHMRRALRCVEETRNRIEAEARAHE
ncbi:RNA polymerase sigma factor [Steroidobacter flavus]|uniref:RNA polymerase sigma factor n=1 Tax=Steroidobacter flavus TaxID=1842136 RepID=A0ABV8T1E3_9GAMM